LKWELRSKLKIIHRALDLLMIYVTHDQVEALTFADKVVVMNDGRAVQIGTPAELFEKPEHTFVGYFIGSPGMNFLSGKINGTGIIIDTHKIELGAAYPALPKDSVVKFGVRPDYTTLSGAGGLPVQVKRIDDLGRKRLAHVTLAGQPLVAAIPNDMNIVGNEAAVTFDLARTHIYVDEHRVEGRPL
jgi:glycerol transport system ATP-binding protein